MQTRKGNDRIVFIFPRIKLVIKIPFIHLFLAFSPFFKKEDRKVEYLKNYFTYPLECYGGFKRLMFKGIVDNWNECYFYWKTKNPFLQPTYFSLFGILNVQLYGNSCNLKTVDLWCQLYELTEGKVFDDSHHFANENNFCFHKEKLRMLDYGSKRTHNVIKQYGKKIVELFNNNYCWEVEKLKFKKLNT